MSTSTVRRDTRSPRRGRGRGGISFTNPRISARNDNLQTSGLSTPPSSKNNRASPRPRGRGAGGNNRSFGRSSPSREALQKAESDMDPDAPGLMTAAQRAKRFGASNKSVIYDQLKQARVNERKEAIKLGLIPDPDARMRLEDAIDFRGTCQSMCPEFERVEREVQKMLDVLEMDEEGNADPSKTVKRYRRSAAGNEQPLPSDVRPPHVLVETLNYLIHDVLMENPFIKCHAFLRDRTRSIRQDFTLQNIRDVTAVHCHERIARFHILAIHELCGYDEEKFSEQQETEQLRKVLLSLMEFYDDLRDSGIETPNEAEFRAYFLMTHAHDHEAARRLMKFPRHVFEHPYLQRALKLYSLLQRNNEIMQTSARRNKFDNIEACQNFYSQFFKLVGDTGTPFLLACMAEWHFPDVRKGALKAMNRAYNFAHKGVEVEYLRQVLAYDSVEQLLREAKIYGLVFDTNDNRTTIRFGQRMPKAKTTFFYEPLSKLRPTKSLLLVDPKKGERTFADIIDGVNEKVPVSDTIKNVYETQDSNLPGGSIIYKTIIPSKRQLPSLDTVQRVAKVARQVRDDYYADRNGFLPQKPRQNQAQKEGFAVAAADIANAQALRQKILEKQQEIERRLAIEKQQLLEREREIEEQKKQRQIEAARAAAEENKRQQELLAQAREERLAKESRARVAAMREATLRAVAEQVEKALEDSILVKRIQLNRQRNLLTRIALPWLDRARRRISEHQRMTEERNAVYRMLRRMTPPGRTTSTSTEAAARKCIAAEVKALQFRNDPDNAFEIWKTENFADMLHPYLQKAFANAQTSSPRRTKPTWQLWIHVEDKRLDSSQWFSSKFGLDNDFCRLDSFTDVNIYFRCVDSNTPVYNKSVDEIGAVIFSLSEARFVNADDLEDDAFWERQKNRLYMFTEQISAKNPQARMRFLFTHWPKSRALKEAIHAIPKKLALDQNPVVQGYHLMLMNPASVQTRLKEELEWLGKTTIIPFPSGYH